jgi:predicted nucleotidyltransferase
MSQLGQALFTTTQQRLLALLYGHPERSFYTKEILRLTKMGVATIKRELDNMTAAGILKKFNIGNQLHYQANEHCPIYSELITIVYKTFGISDIIKTALMPLSDHITWAFIFGSIANNKEASLSDIDLMIIGELSFSDVVQALYSIQNLLAREINPKIYTKQEWEKLQLTNNVFVKDILEKTIINLIGDGHEFREFSRHIIRKNND